MTDILKIDWLLKNGFSEEGVTYCIVGENTYSIKDHLKSQGFKYSPLLGWHGAEPASDLPSDFLSIAIDFAEIYIWSEKYPEYKEDAKITIDRIFKEAIGPSKSSYLGTPGERIRNLTATLTAIKGFAGVYGWTNIYSFKCGDDILVWMTSSTLDLPQGATVDFTGTVKSHEEFRGVKTTRFSRCIVKEIN